MNRTPDPADTKAAALQTLRADFQGNDAAAQRALLLVALQSHGVISTIEARAFLDILHPAGRIKELRGLGHNIVTLWADKPTEAGKLHRVGVYLLARVPAEAEVAP